MFVQTNNATKWERASRVNMDRCLRFEASKLQYLNVSTGGPLSRIGTGDWTFGFYVYRHSNTNQIVFQTYSSPNIFFSVTTSGAFAVTVLATGFAQKQALTSKVIKLNNFAFVIAKRNINRLTIKFNNEIVYNNADFFVGTVNLTTNAISTIGTRAGLQNSFSDISMSHFMFFNKSLSESEDLFIHTNGGIIPASAHASCMVHYPLTQKYGDVAYDVVEQYNYAKPAINSWNDNSGGVAVQKLVGDGYIETTFEALAAASFLDDYQIGLSTTPEIAFDNGSVKNTIDFGVQYGTNGKLLINSSLYSLEYSANDIFRIERIGSTVNFYQNGNILSDATRINQTTVDLYIKKVIYSSRIQTYPVYLNGVLLSDWSVSTALNKDGRLTKSYALTANHAELKNFEHPWYANHQFNVNGYTGVLYSTMVTRLPQTGVDVIFNADNVEYNVNTIDSNSTGLQLSPNTSIQVGKTYVAEVDWEYFRNDVIVSSSGIRLHLSSNGDFGFKQESFDRITETFEITVTNSTSGVFLVCHGMGCRVGDFIKVYGIKIWEKDKQRFIDSSPRGTPDPASNEDWLDFYSLTPAQWIQGLNPNGDIIESLSGYPEIKKAISTGANGNQFLYRNIAADGLGEQDYTLIFALQMHNNYFRSVDNADLFLYCKGPTSSDNLVVFGSGVNRGFRVNLTVDGVPHTGQWNLPESVILTDINLFAVTFTIKNGKHYRQHFLNGVMVYEQNNWPGAVKLDFTRFNDSSTVNSFRLLDNPSSGANSVDANNLFFAMYSKCLTEKELLEINNNTIFKNPENKTKLEMWINHSDIFDDSGVLKIRDQSVHARHLQLSGWASQNTYTNQLININDQR